MKKILLLVFALLLFQTASLIAQDITLPPLSTLKTQQDLDRTSEDLVKAANWLEQNPLITAMDKRKEVERFVFMWISASKKVNVEMNSKILSLDDKNPGLVMVYTAAAARYLINNKSADTKAGQLAALKTVSNMYKTSTGIHKDKNLDELVKAEKKGKIMEWVNH